MDNKQWKWIDDDGYPPKDMRSKPFWVYDGSSVYCTTYIGPPFHWGIGTWVDLDIEIVAYMSTDVPEPPKREASDGA